jgi:hypothetical protein
MFSLSQGQLNVLENCPRKFEYLYLDCLHPPRETRMTSHREIGKQFHRLMQQREMGLPIAAILQEYPDFNRWIAALENVAPELFCWETDTFRASEYLQTLKIDEFIFTAVFDLVILGKTATIIDWKTYLNPPPEEAVRRSWQTRLYQYILAETHNYQPADIMMTYWCVRTQPQPKPITIPYDAKEHDRITRDLQSHLDRLRHWLTEYRQTKTPLPQLPQPNSTCQDCQFAPRCHIDPPSSMDFFQSLDISTIPEIVI